MNGETELAVKIVDRLNDVAKEIDYDGLIDKVEEVNRVQPDIVEQFKNKTKEHFHKIKKENKQEISEESESFPMKKTFRERLEEKKQRVKEMNMKDRNRENKNVGIICN